MKAASFITAIVAASTYPPDTPSVRQKPVSNHQLAASVPHMTRLWPKPSMAFEGTEAIRRRTSWRRVAEAALEILKRINGFNNKHLLEPTGNTPPAKAEAAFHANLNKTDMVA